MSHPPIFDRDWEVPAGHNFVRTIYRPGNPQAEGFLVAQTAPDLDIVDRVRLARLIAAAPKLLAICKRLEAMDGDKFFRGTGAAERMALIADNKAALYLTGDGPWPTILRQDNT